MSGKEKDFTDFTYSIKRVKDIYFSINERLYISDPNKVIKIELGHQIGFNTELNLVKFTLRIYFHYQDSSEILFDIQVENIFEIQDVSRFMKDNGIIILPQELIVSIVSMSLSHGRALLLKNTAGTVWQEIILPITNPFEVAKHFYPYMFSGEMPLMSDDGNNTGNKKEASSAKKGPKIKPIKTTHSKNSY